MLKSYNYNSCLAPYIEGLIKQKRLSGYSYEFEAYILKKFDDYCLDKELNDAVITRELIKDWATWREYESKGYYSQRISFIRQLSIYMNSLGILSYIPQKFYVKEKHIPHIFSDVEISELFYIIDHYVPAKNSVIFSRMAMEYRVLFRLIYCCGLRNSEACSIKASNVDLGDGVVTIIHSKGNKDRLVYMSEDLKILCQEYWTLLKENFVLEPEYFFPGRLASSCIPNTSVDRKFNEFWAKTSCSNNCDKKPTVHSLRHTFVVKRMNLWMEQNLSLNTMMPYLSKFLGHHGKNETFYYYHQVDSAFKIIKKKDKISEIVIPEVPEYEK